MKKFLLLISIIYFSGCSNPEKQTNNNSMGQKIFNSNVSSFQTKFIMGFENEDHSLIMSLFADSVKWTGPDKKLLSQSWLEPMSYKQFTRKMMPANEYTEISGILNGTCNY